MLVNKYNMPRRALYQLYRFIPITRLFKRASLPLKIRKLRNLVALRKQELEQAQTTGQNDPLFTHVEIETVNRCNGECGFCPVNRHIDPRAAARMTDELFYSIIAQLRELDYAGSIFPFSNNEPLLDTRIFDFVEHIRKELPRAQVHFYTNGTLLDREKYLRLAPLVDAFTINDYGSDFRLHPNIREIHELAESSPERFGHTRITVRYREEVMTSRGGQSPNKKDILHRTLPVGCLLPARQMIVRPDGKLSLCCNDALGTMTLGDANKERLIDLWNADAWKTLRRNVLDGRNHLDLCRHCDTLHF